MSRQPPKIILASRSPRRRELLETCGYDFLVVPPDDSDEGGETDGEAPEQLVARLARQKAADAAARRAARGVLGVVLGCDTVVACGGRILGKPCDEDHARQMLRTIRGQEHSVLSGLCLWDAATGRERTRVAVTRLVMSPIDDDQLQAYLQSGKWEGKAGAFGYQDGHDWLQIVEGSATNVVGLPMELLAELLAEVTANADGYPLTTND